MRGFYLAVLLIMGTMLLHGKPIEVQGHRGARGVSPENSLPSFADAFQAGVDAVELDLLMTRDGTIVIYHDYHLNPNLVCYLDGTPLPESPLLIRDLDLSEIKQCDCGSKAHPHFTKQRLIPGTQIPTLEELFAMVPSNVRLNLEIKRESSHPEWTAPPDVMADALLALVRKWNMQDRVYYSSFDPDTLRQMRSYDPDAKLAFLVEDNLGDMLAIAQEVQADTLSPEHILVDADSVRSWQQLDFKVIVWTVNDAERWEQLVHMGVDGIITDYPEKCVHFLQKSLP